MTLTSVVVGELRKGYGVASGPSADYPHGALERQVPIFKSRGLDLSDCFLGTLNLDIHPHVFEIVKPEFTFRAVRWTDLHPPEDFSFSRCQIFPDDGEYDGWIYYPHPETKLRHFQNPSLLEVMAPFVPGLSTGQMLRIRLNPDRVVVRNPEER